MRPRSAVIQVLCERLAVPKLRCSGAWRATSSTNTAIVRCLASVPVGPCLVLFSLCARAHFFCFHPKIAVPCIILTLGPVTSRCLRRPCWVLRAACSTKTAMNHIRSHFFFSVCCAVSFASRFQYQNCDLPALIASKKCSCLRRPRWAVPR